MAIYYDKILGRLRDGTGGGGVSISGEAETFALLPDPTTYAGEYYIVKTSTGVWFISRKESGMYLSDGVNWNRLGNWDQAFQNITSEKFIPQTTAPSYAEGVHFYDNSKKALSYYNDISDISVNIGQEVLFRVENQSGSLIPNGSVITPDSSDIITLANAHFKEKSQLIAVMTHDIADGAMGYATKLGQVGGLDTSSYPAGTVLYLSDSVDGAFVDTRPTDGSYSVIVGVVDVQDATDGIITVDTRSSDLTVEVTDTNGFPSDQRTGTTLSIVDGTRTFTIAPTGAHFHFYQTGDKYEKESAENIVIADIEGLHVIYYDDGVLSEIVNPTDGQIDEAIRTKALIAYVYWDATNSASSYFADERHGISMSPVTHSYNHFTRGAQYLSGLGLGDFVISDGDTNEDAQFSSSLGMIADEDLTSMCAGSLSTAGLPIYYLDGASGDMRRMIRAGFPVNTSDGTNATRLVYNEWTGSTWQLTEVTNNDFVLCHVIAINGYAGKDQIVAIVGQNDYATRTLARAGASTEISSISVGFPFQEAVPIGTIIYQTSSGYDNDVQARIIPDIEDNNYTDWRTTELAQGANPSDHNNLTNLQLSGTGVTWGHVSDQAQTIYGAKTFDSDISAQNIESGRYTPTLTAVTNVNVSGAYAGHYLKIDNEVSVSMRVNVDPTTASTTTELGISLPIASSLTSTQDASGVGSQSDTNSNGIISADTTNNRATLKFESIDTTNRDWWVTFAYQVK